MDQSTLANLAAPAVALIVSLATFVATQQRAQRQDERTEALDRQKAAKDTVELLVTQNQALRDELESVHANHSDLLDRFNRMEQLHHECQQQLVEMSHRIEVLQASQSRVQVVVQPSQPQSLPQTD